VHHAQPNVRTDDTCTNVDANSSPNCVPNPFSISVSDPAPIWQPNHSPIVDADDHSKRAANHDSDPVSHRNPNDVVTNSRAELHPVSIAYCVTCADLQT